MMFRWHYKIEQMLCSFESNWGGVNTPSARVIDVNLMESKDRLWQAKSSTPPRFLHPNFQKLNIALYSKKKKKKNKKKKKKKQQPNQNVTVQYSIRSTHILDVSLQSWQSANEGKG